MKIKAADAGKKLVKKAAKLPKPVESTKSTPPSDVKLPNGETLLFTYPWATHLSDEQFEWVFSLFAKNMEDMYRQSDWGYDEASKRAELRATTARYVLVKSSSGKNVAYMHYRFVIEADQPVLYCYELQIESEYQRQKIGSKLLDIAESVANRTGMEKVYATVFKFNAQSLNFFRARGYENDENFPECETKTDYYVVSKRACANA